jgi:excisionase family DNA binding protein
MTTNPVKKHWFSIQEASDYLDIGEPTLYRWMREKKITFRKVGDSTRFYKEDLDDVMQVFPSEKLSDRAKTFCPYCHHTDLVPGTVQGTGGLHFRPAKTKFWTLLDANVEASSLMCSRCGGIVWFGDVKKLQALREKAAELAVGESAERPSSQEESQ